MRQVGYTLVEIAVVVVILSLVAAALLQTSASVDAEQTLDAAAAEVAAAFRFARSEAIRTGQPYGVESNSFTQQVRVYRLDTSVSPPVADYSVLHPVDRKLYELNFSTDPLLGAVSMTHSIFWFSGVFFPVGFIGFNASGTPKYEDLAGTHMLASGSVGLAAANQARTVQITPMTGRVTIQ